MIRKRSDRLDMEAMLRGVALPTAAAEPVEAGFFHRTLARWLGLAEGRTPGKRVTEVVWSYAFWKAELLRTWGTVMDADGGRQIWQALVFRDPRGEPERYEYWLDLDAQARIRRSGWISDAPDLLKDGGTFAPAPVDQGALSRLFDDPDADGDGTPRA